LGPVTAADKLLRRESERVLGPVRRGIAYPQIPSVHELHLPATAPAPDPAGDAWLSPGLCDPYIEEARRLKAYDDFKLISDARPLPLFSAEKTAILDRARAAARSAGGTQASRRRASLRVFLDRHYDFADETEPAPLVAPQWKITSGDAARDAAFATTERILPRLLRRAPVPATGSLLPTPYPFLIAAPGRFRESYYWDTYFGLKGVLATHRIEIAQMQADNLLEEVRRFGFVPNGTRDYYLSRSQPPLLSSLVREVYEASATSPNRSEWLRRRAYPLMRLDYEKFWMRRQTRWDPDAGLNHDWDALDLPRPERHGADDETRLGRSYRDVRAAAESGLDFTVAMGGEASRVAGVLLNALLYKTERDLEWAANELGLKSEAAQWAEAAQRRQRAIDARLWRADRGEYDNFNLRTGAPIPILSAVTFAPLFVGAASAAQAAAVVKALPRLERAGGLMASEATLSSYQWDGTNGWAPLQILAIEGLRRYGYEREAKRLAEEWVGVIALVHHRTGILYERYDVAKADYPGADGSKYPVQEGFLWTNSSFVWALTAVLGVPLKKIDER
jgi:alpha,alpha-trehalase